VVWPVFRPYARAIGPGAQGAAVKARLPAAARRFFSNKNKFAQNQTMRLTTNAPPGQETGRRPKTTID